MRLIVLLLVFSTTGVIAQTIITGKATDQFNKLPIPGTSVYIENTYLGTVTNKDGRFRFSVSDRHKNNYLYISSIGYETRILRLNEIKSPINIELQRDTTQLNEVLVMPKDTLLALLRRAYGKIKDNYPDFDTKVNGVYRESFYIPQKNEYLYFGEAQLDIFKTSYKNKTEGQVKIVNSRMNKHPLYDSLSSVMWYGGVHLPTYSDKVKVRSSFISPKTFDKYDYNILSAKFEGKTVYKVDFHPKESEKERFKGAFYLDKESLAYLYFEYTFTNYGKKKRNSYLSRSLLETIFSKTIIKYRKVDGIYYLSYISDFESLFSKKIEQEMVQFNEYITTDINSQNADPIPFADQSQYRDVFFIKSKDIQETTWKGSNIIIPDSALTKLIEYTPDKAQYLLNKKHQLPKDYQFKQKLVKVITRMYFDIDFETRTTSEIVNANILYAPSLNHNFGKNFNARKEQVFSYGMKMGYKFNRKWDVNCYAASSLGKYLWELESVGFAYETPIVNRGRQLLFMGGVNYFFSKAGYYLGNYKSGHSFRAGRKKIRADKIALYIGKKKQGVSFDLGLKTKLYRFYSLFVMAGYRVNFSERDRLFIKEKSGFILTRKNTDISLKDSSIRYFENRVQTTKTSFDTDDFYLKAGIRFAF